MSDNNTQTLKGFRDFLPEDMAIQNYIFNVWREMCDLYGFEEYSTPVLEPIEIYSKSGDEVGSSGKELYSFIDQGGRNVALRPEMTPSVGKLVATYQKQLTLPVKWFSIAQFFRAEKPQRGRTREFYQLNADIFGSKSTISDVEIISLGIDIMLKFNATKEMFTVRINNRKFTDYYFSNEIDIKNEENRIKLLKIIDSYPKKDDDWLKDQLKDIRDEDGLIDKVKSYMELKFEDLKDFYDDSEGAKQIVDLFRLLETIQKAEYCTFDPKMARGFDYYTGMVFEVFDNDPKNSRSLFGGGRYDNLLDIFDKPKIPAVGFAPGDVTLKLFLESWKLLPNNLLKPANCLVTIFDEKLIQDSLKTTQFLRNNNLDTEIYPDPVADLPKQLKYADKRNIPWVIIIGPEEKQENKISIKNMKTGNQEKLNQENLLNKLK